MSIKSQYDPGVIKTEKGFYSTLFRLHDMGREICIPAIVKEYNSGSHIATVVPLVKNVYEEEMGDKILEERNSVRVRVLAMRCGGFKINMPLYRNDTGIIIACDRGFEFAASKNCEPPRSDNEYLKDKNKGPQEPDLSDILKFENGVFIPFAFTDKDFPLAGANNNLTIEKIDEDGRRIFIDMWAGGMRVVRTDEKLSNPESVTFDKNGIKYEGHPDRTVQKLTDLRYNIDTHQIQKKTVMEDVRGDFVVGVSEESGWTMIEGGQVVEETV